jgi:hypothetical protein
MRVFDKLATQDGLSGEYLRVSQDAAYDMNVYELALAYMPLHADKRLSDLGSCVKTWRSPTTSLDA